MIKDEFQKRCPFCGRKAVVLEIYFQPDILYFYVQCDYRDESRKSSCDLRGPNRKTHEQAIYAWNMITTISEEKAMRSEFVLEGDE